MTLKNYWGEVGKGRSTSWSASLGKGKGGHLRPVGNSANSRGLPTISGKKNPTKSSRSGLHPDGEKRVEGRLNSRGNGIPSHMGSMSVERKRVINNLPEVETGRRVAVLVQRARN